MTASSCDAFLIVTHGSRDPRPGVAAAQLAKTLSQRLQPSHSVYCVEAAALEFADCPLHQQILQVGDRLCKTGIERLTIVPLFLLAGVHVKEDVPHEVELAQLALGDRLTLQILPYLGQSPLMQTTLAQLFDSSAAGLETRPSRLLLAHGSRRAAGNRGVEALATQLQATPAYWSIAPHLDEQVTHFVRAGQRHIVILPYFLFPGGITDAIAQQVAQLRQRFPNLDLQMTPLLGDSDGFERLVAEAVQCRNNNDRADLIPCNFQ